MKNLYEQYLISETNEEPNAHAEGETVGRLAPPLQLIIDTGKLTVTAKWGWNGKHSYIYKAKTLKQAWWHWYNPWKGFMGDYDKRIRKEGGIVDYNK